MHQHYRLCRFIALCLPLLTLPPPAGADDREREARSQLELLQGEIERIGHEISTRSERRDSIQQQLREAEVELGRLQRETADNERAITASEQELAELQQRRGELESARDAQRERIAIELKAAWQLGEQSQVKLLLNQEDPQAMARMLTDYRYFFAARNRLIDTYRETLSELAALTTRIDRTLEQLAGRQAELAQQRAEVEAAQATREAAVAELNAGIRSRSEQLDRMQEDRKRLEELLAAIERALVELEVPEDYQPFKAARGKMPWPLAGKRSNHFGRPRNDGKMQWQGIEIPAPEGAGVKAIHHGRVVYADWLRGSGLLMIIDHGDGYMSLYAHNQSLLREVGEWVSAGTPISTVGNSGGQDQPALYFEIRHDGKPVNPAQWCRD